MARLTLPRMRLRRDENGTGQNERLSMPGRRAPSILESFNFAFEWLIHVLRTQRNMRAHFAIAVVVLVAGLWVGVSKLELIALLLAIAFVFITEMINSALEQAIDVATTSFDPLAKLAKDVAAGAVLIATVNAVAIGYLVYLIASRTGPIAGAIVAMGVFSLNPASWLVSAYWGQADSVAAVFLVWSLYLAVTKRFELAWLVFAFAVLIKPQPLVLAPLLLIWQIRTQGVTWRLALVPLIGLAVAYAGSLPFSPGSDPVGVLTWLYARYHAGITVYPYNSVNALNLYSINRDFFQPDTQPIQFFGFDLGPQYAWGMGIFIALLAAIAWRLWRALGDSSDDDARELTLYTACFVASLGFFMVVTRQHERYLFTALAIVPLLWNASPVMRLATVVLSATFAYNLFYALQYLAAPSQGLNPLIVHQSGLTGAGALMTMKD